MNKLASSVNVTEEQFANLGASALDRLVKTELATYLANAIVQNYGGDVTLERSSAADPFVFRLALCAFRPEELEAYVLKRIEDSKNARRIVVADGGGRVLSRYRDDA